ncbi:hypothetical protein BGZ76_001094 [Entomortierella beljakovae]|nr:hypothetical protein BGZ76_001094 [Entomortierella beljakovae]
MVNSHYILANPFAGQNIGHLRFAVVGDSGVGKTLFARQFVETLPEVLSHDWEERKTDEDGEEEYEPTLELTEKYASTMMEIPWDNMDNDDEVPARNLVFLDTPGYGSVIDAQTNFNQFLNYMSSTFEEKSRVGAHKFVDICFYVVLHRLKPIDIEYMRLISEKANVVPIIAKVDTQSEEEVRELKVNILKTLKEKGVSIYTFRIEYERLINMAESGTYGGPPFAVSNILPRPSSDDPEDQIPFKHAANELPLLRKLVLETQITNIRMFTVKKFINWRGKQQTQQSGQQQQQQQQQQPFYHQFPQQ